MCYDRGFKGKQRSRFLTSPDAISSAELWYPLSTPESVSSCDQRWPTGAMGVYIWGAVWKSYCALSALKVPPGVS